MFIRKIKHSHTLNIIKITDFGKEIIKNFVEYQLKVAE